FGYGAPLWSATGVAVGWFMGVARLVASWPGTDITMPSMPAAALVAFAAGLTLLAVLRTRLALVAALPVVAGLALATVGSRPTVMVGAGGHAALASGEGSV